jgi:hypothetical protein
MAAVPFASVIHPAVIATPLLVFARRHRIEDKLFDPGSMVAKVVAVVVDANVT